MSASTHLLPKDRKKDDHPIFLRVCHSPWMSIGQKALVGLRGLTTAYMFVAGAMIIDFEIKRNQAGWLTLFKFSNFQWGLQLLYQVVALTYTFMHLHYPHHASQQPSFATKMQKLLSPPRQHATTGNRTWFSIFYTAANTFPWVSAFIFWMVLLPKGKAEHTYEEIFENSDWFIKFYVFNKWAVSAAIAFIEVFFFCSIRRQVPVYAHVVGLAFLSWIYLGWAYVGHAVTKKYVWYFLDHEQVGGWDHVVSAWAAFAVLTNFFFGVNYAITGAREKMTKKGEQKNTGYQALPQ